MVKGELVPDEVIIGVAQDRLSQRDCNGGYILDGFPRTVPQAEALTAFLADNDSSISHVAALDVPEEDLVKRLSGRRTCQKCGAGYHQIFAPPTNQDFCDKCGGDLYQREDDQEDTIRERLRVYKELTEPLIRYYNDQGALHWIEGVGSFEDVLTRLKNVLDGEDKAA